MPVFCFIDDAQFELDNFAANAADAFKGVELVYATTFAGARAELADRRPLLFLLDLYGRDPEVASPHLPAAEDLAGALAPPPSYEDLTAGIESAVGEAGNLFLRRLHALVTARQEAFVQASQAMGQSSAYGMENLRRVRVEYPWAAALAYSRKALYADAAAFSQAGGDGVLIKPQGADEEEIAASTRRQARELARVCFQAVARHLIQQVALISSHLCLAGEGLPLAELLHAALGHLEAPGLARPEESVEEIVGRLEDLHTGELGLEAWQQEAIWALREWLAGLT